MNNDVWLVIRGIGSESGPGVFRIRHGQYEIGRSKRCQICLLHILVSRRHAMLINDGGKLLIRDLGSRNGTFVDGKPIQSREDKELKVGSSIRIGSVTLEVVANLADVAHSAEDVESTPPSPVHEPGDVLLRAQQLPPFLKRVLVLLVDGCAEKQIAERLGLTAHTVHSYVKEIHKALGVQSRAQLCAYYRDTKIIPVEQPEAAAHFPAVPHARPGPRSQSMSNVW